MRDTQYYCGTTEDIATDGIGPSLLSMIGKIDCRLCKRFRVLYAVATQSDEFPQEHQYHWVHPHWCDNGKWVYPCNNGKHAEIMAKAYRCKDYEECEF
jgi:hypothetical protein